MVFFLPQFCCSVSYLSIAGGHPQLLHPGEQRDPQGCVQVGLARQTHPLASTANALKMFGNEKFAWYAGTKVRAGDGAGAGGGASGAGSSVDTGDEADNVTDF